MKIVEDSPEHHFLTFIDKLRPDSAGWLGFRFALSETLDHADIISQPGQIRGKLHKVAKQSSEVSARLAGKLKDSQSATLYRFADGDVVLLLRPGSEAMRKTALAVFEEMCGGLGKALCTKTNMAQDLYAYQKLADERFLAVKRVEAYNALADANRVQSIPLRRQRREDAVVLIVEDDRFTASYAANILNRDYDIVTAKTGEEAVALYIEYAPDVVLLDIHLPGLDGLDTLRALRKADPEACVFMLSVDTVKQNIVMAHEEGAMAFLKKPFGKDRLLAAVAKSPFVKALADKKRQG